MSRLLYTWETSNWYTLSWPQGRSGHLRVQKKLLHSQELNHDSSNVVLFMSCILLQVICQPTSALNKIQFMTILISYMIRHRAAIIRESFKSNEYNPNALV